MENSLNMPGKYSTLCKTSKLISYACLATTCLASQGQKVDSSSLFNGKFTDIKLQQVTVRLGQPTQVTAQLGWHMSWENSNAWAFIHLTPQIARFPNGQLLATYTEDPDTQKNPLFESGFQISDDGGAHWGRRYSMIMQHIGMTFIPQPNNSLLGLPSELMPEKDGDDRDFTGPLLTFEDGGKRMVADLNGFHVVAWPWPISVISSTQPKSNWHCSLFFNGNYVKVKDALLATVYWSRKGQKGEVLSLAASKDGGHTWRYYSTIAKPEDILPQMDREKKDFEGPNESSVLRLADGKLLAIFRVGNGMNLRESLSDDDGLTWTTPIAIPPFSVDPQAVRLANGAIALATGRPGIHLWISTDGTPTAQSWQDVDIVDHHNELNMSPGYSITSNGRWGQTSSYTGLVEVAPNRLLLLYDRDPEGVPASTQDLSRLFVMPIEIVRK